MFDWGIRQRVIFVAVVPGAAIALGLAIYFLALRYADVEAALESRGAALSRQLAPAAEYGAFSGNGAELRRLALATLRDPDVAAVAIHDARGAALAVVGQPTLVDAPLQLSDGWSGRSGDGERLYFHAKIIRAGLAAEDPFLVAAPPQELGSVTLEMTRRRVIVRRREILVVTAMFTAALLAAAAMLAWRLGRDVTEPVLALDDVVGRIRHGELDARVAAHPAGTLAKLEAGINEMAAALEATQRRSRAALADSEAELREQHRFAGTLLAAQSDAGVGTLLLEDGRVIYADASAVAICGYAAGELAAAPSFLDLVAPEMRGDEWRDFVHYLGGEARRHRYALPIRGRDGTARTIEMAVAALPGAHGRRILGVVIDITERKRDELRLAAAYDELKLKKEEAERASLAKSRFLAAAGHDLRQPLHALTLFAAQAELLAATPPQSRLAEQIGRAAESMGELLAALLDISRLDLAELVVKLRPLPLAPLLERIAAAHRGAAEAAGLRLTCLPSAVWVRSDPQLLARMIDNLVGNAVRYTQRGRILVGVRREAACVRLEVHDTGIGIAAEHLHNIFQEFYQVGNEERDTAKGLGLGLAIVERLGNALGHRVAVRSRPGRGSCFSIALPRAAAAPLPPDEAEPAADFAARVLVVCETRPDRDSLTALLRGWGCSVIEARRPGEIAAALARGHADVIVCDDCCYDEARRELDGTAAPPPLVLIGEAPPGAAPAGRLAKPLRPARLRALLRHLLDEQTAA